MQDIDDQTMRHFCFTMRGYCLNGAPCNERDGCDCSQSLVGDTTAGKLCQYIATEYCTLDLSVSQSAFCVNGGSCRSLVDPSSTSSSSSSSSKHPGCDCPKGWKGDHCELLSNADPQLGYAMTYTAILIFFMVLLCGMRYLYYKLSHVPRDDSHSECTACSDLSTEQSGDFEDDLENPEEDSKRDHDLEKP